MSNKATIREKNMQALGAEMVWFGQVLANCLAGLGLLDEEAREERLPAPAAGTRYGDFVREYNLGREERLVLMLALLPYIKPDSLSALDDGGQGKEHFGCLRGKQFSGVIPTVQTALTLLSGGDLAARIDGFKLFMAETGSLTGRGVIRLGSSPPEEPRTCAPLLVDEEALARILSGSAFDPASEFSGSAFPARRLQTPLDWDDLVLAPVVLSQLRDIVDWAAHAPALHEILGLGGHLRPGYKVLFYGPSGTGKTLTAALLGKRLERPVYRVDLSQVVSKYIGETEKNLEQLFRLAEHKDWVIFFDEADALFNKRTDVEDAHDRHANQETAFLLQRLESYPNLVVMATNMQDNIDPAFARRFNCGIFFPLPGREERLRLWRDCLGQKLRLSAEAQEIAAEERLSGGQIANIALRLGLWSLNNKTTDIPPEALRRAVMLERVLQGKV